MAFSVKTNVVECESFETFCREWNIGEKDLVITEFDVLKNAAKKWDIGERDLVAANKCVPKIDGKPLPCKVLFQNAYGKGEPTDEMIDAMLSACETQSREEGKIYERVIAIGGGSIIDIAKLFVFGDGLRCAEIFEKGAALPRKRKLVVIPTTCGTGSEVTNISIVAFIKKQTKQGLAIPALFPDEAVLIGSVLNGLPYEVFATSSIDALIHAAESYISPKANAFTRSLGRSAIELILQGYGILAEKNHSRKEKTLPDDLSPFLKASTMAGIAFGNAGVGAVHALSYPIGAIYHVPHGMANYMLFEKVFEAYRRLNADLSPLEEILVRIMNCSRSDVWEKFFSLLSTILTLKPLRTLGVTEANCKEMAASVIKLQQRLLVNNPISLSQGDIESIYRSCL